MQNPRLTDDLLNEVQQDLDRDLQESGVVLNTDERSVLTEIFNEPPRAPKPPKASSFLR